MEQTFRVNATVLLIGTVRTGAVLVLVMLILSVAVLEADDHDSGCRQLDKTED